MPQGENIPLTNFGFFITTPPASPTIVLDREGQLIEYLVPYPVHVEGGDWPTLSIKVSGCDLNIAKPISGAINSQLPLAQGNQGGELYYSVWRVFAPDPDAPALDEINTFSAVAAAIEWVRIIGRQFWLLQGSAGVGAVCRGTSFLTNSHQHAQRNFANYKSSIVLRPLSRELWISIGAQISAACTVPTAEAIYCDALYSIAAGSIAKALIELGVAAEVQLTNLLDDVAKLRPTAPASVEYRRRRSKRSDKFHWKLFDCSRALRLDDPQTYKPTGGPNGWATDLDVLYKFRNSTAHSGSSTVFDPVAQQDRKVTSGELARFAFAVEALFHWEQEQRLRLQTLRHTHTWANFQDRPIVGICESTNAPGFVGSTNWSTALRT